jgi:hypothetical protein
VAEVVVVEFIPAVVSSVSGFAFLLGGVSESIRLGGETYSEGSYIQLAV